MRASMNDVIQAVFEEFGGRENFFRESQQQLDYFNRLWDRDTELVGRVLRAHLVVEHFLTEYIQTTNPRLPSLDDVGISFEAKVRLLPSDVTHIQMIVPGIRQLNRIRNTIAHRLEVEISTEERSSFLGVPVFAAMRNEMKKRNPDLPDAPIDVLEDFAKLAANWLQGGADGSSEKWQRAIARTYPPISD